MDLDDTIKALDQLEPTNLSKRAALDRLLAHVRLALARGVTVDAIADCLFESGIRLSPDQLRAYLAAGRAPGRPPETATLIRAAGPVSALRPERKKPGRPRRSADDML